MEKTYKYRFSRRAIYWTLVYLVVFVLLGWLLYHLYEGGYLSAWFTSFIVALIALMSLSIPRRIVVTDEKVEVRCLLDITEIRRDEIASVRRVDPKRMKWFLPIFGGCGFFGYYGHFIDLRRLDRVRLYASEWRNFVEITDIYEDRLYVSCADADRLVGELDYYLSPTKMPRRRHKRQPICIPIIHLIKRVKDEKVSLCSLRVDLRSRSRRSRRRHRPRNAVRRDSRRLGLPRLRRRQRHVRRGCGIIPSLPEETARRTPQGALSVCQAAENAPGPEMRPHNAPGAGGTRIQADFYMPESGFIISIRTFACSFERRIDRNE